MKRFLLLLLLVCLLALLVPVNAASPMYLVQLADGFTLPEGLHDKQVREGMYLLPAEQAYALERSGLTEFIEPNGVVELLSSQWNLDAVFAEDAIYHTDTRSRYDRRGSGVTVAVIDSGVDAENLDFFAANLLPYRDFTGSDEGVESWHGTFVAGIIAAQVDNDLGINGAASDVTILPIRITRNGSSDFLTTIQAIDYAVAQGADVINLSIGSKIDSLSLALACRDAAEKGVIIVAAAGNYAAGETPDALNYMYPAGYDCVISVSGCKQGANAPEFDGEYSYFNDEVDVCAPGTRVRSLYSSGMVAASSGTSFAAPMVTAMAAIAKQANPAITGTIFRALLYATATDLGAPGKDVYYGAGLVNFSALLDALEERYPITYLSDGAQAQFADEAPRYYTTSDAALTLPTPVRPGWSFHGWYENESLTGAPVSTLPAASIGPKTYYAAWSEQPNLAPTVTGQAPADVYVTPAGGGFAAIGYEADVSEWFRDANREPLTITMTDGPGALDGTVYRYTPNAADAGKTFTARFFATDGYGAQSPVHSLTIHISELPTGQPILLGSTLLSLDLCQMPQQVHLPLSLYGDTVTALTLNRAALPYQMDGETVIFEMPTLSEGDFRLTVAFAKGTPVSCTIHVFRDCPSKGFRDVAKEGWYHAGVDYAVRGGLMLGVGNGLFSPGGSVTRAMLVTILYRLAGQPAIDVKSPFADVEAGRWYTDAVSWAECLGIVNGVTHTKFSPNAPITREQLITILCRYAGRTAPSASLADFPDGSSVSPFAMAAMQWGIGSGLIGGVAGAGGTTLSPKAGATRAQVAVILERFH